MRPITWSGPAWRWPLGVVVIAAISLLASVFLTATAQGIAVLMIYGAGLTAGLLGQIGHALDSDALKSIARVASWALPFEALYQAALHALVSNTTGLTGTVLQARPVRRRAGGRGRAWSFGAAVYIARRARARDHRLRPPRPVAASRGLPLSRASRT